MAVQRFINKCFSNLKDLLIGQYELDNNYYVLQLALEFLCAIISGINLHFM